MGFPINFPSMGKCNKTRRMGRTWEVGTHTVLIVWVFFSPSNSHPMVYFIIWEMHGFSHQFPIVQENATKPIIWGGPGKLVLTIFPWYGCFCPIWFPSCGILHYMGNAWVFPSISHSTGKCTKTQRKAWEIGNSYFSHSMGAFLQPDSHHVIYFITWEMLRFHHQSSVSHSIGKCSEIHRIERAWEIGTHTFPKVWVLFSIRFLTYGISYPMENAWLSPSISHSINSRHAGTKSKIYQKRRRGHGCYLIKKESYEYILGKSIPTDRKISLLLTISSKNYNSYPKISTKSAATVAFGRKVSEGYSFKKDSQFNSYFSIVM